MASGLTWLDRPPLELEVRTRVASRTCRTSTNTDFKTAFDCYALLRLMYSRMSDSILTRTHLAWQSAIASAAKTCRIFDEPFLKPSEPIFGTFPTARRPHFGHTWHRSNCTVYLQGPRMAKFYSALIIYFELHFGS